MRHRLAIVLAFLVLVTACSGRVEQTTPSPPTSPNTSGSPGPVESATPSASAPSTPTGPQPAWLARMNSYRTSFGVPAVTADTELSKGARLHARYMAQVGLVTREQNPESAQYTRAGSTAAASSLVAAGYDTQTAFVDAWASSPFQLINLLDSRLTESGFGMATGTIGTAAALDVASSRDAAALTDGWPRVWPRGETDIRQLGPADEPDATTGCPEPAAGGWFGTPILVDFGPTATIESAQASLTVDGSPLAACVRVASDYTDELASSLMAGKALVIPLDILATGATVNGTVTTPVGVATVSFSS